MKSDPELRPLWFTLSLGLLVGIVATIFILLLSCGKAEAAEAPNSFVEGYQHASTFLNPKKKRGKNFRKRLTRIATLYQGYCEIYMPDYVPECLIRILVESDGHEGSRTKDTTAREAGATSIGYGQAVTLCEEYGVCGDPCWDREFAVGAFAWLLYHDRKTLLEDSPYWSEWLPKACERGRAECELIITLNLDVNSGKVEKVMRHVKAQKAKHPWWHTIKWFKKQTDDSLNKMFSPLAVTLKRFGIRWGLAWMKQKIRKERYGGKYSWGSMLEQPPAKPPAKKAMPSEKDWRKECHLYKSAAWFKTHPTMSKKSKKKYLK